MAQVIAMNQIECWKGIAAAPTVRRCGSLQEQYAGFKAAAGALREERALLIRLPKTEHEVVPSGFIALQRLSEESAGKGGHLQCLAKYNVLLRTEKNLQLIMAWLNQMPGNWGEDSPLEIVRDMRSGHSVLGIRIKNIILFRSSLHALEAKLGQILVELAVEGARLFPAQVVSEARQHHHISHIPYKAVISGPWKARHLI